jgi:hypothetical protein
MSLLWQLLKIKEITAAFMRRITRRRSNPPRSWTLLQPRHLWTCSTYCARNWRSTGTRKSSKNTTTSRAIPQLSLTRPAGSFVMELDVGKLQCASIICGNQTLGEV